MDSFNKVLSFILGLIVVVVLLVVVTNRFRGSKSIRFIPLESKSKVTPKPTAGNAKTQSKIIPTRIITPGLTKGGVSTTQETQRAKVSRGGIKTIPKTGAPTALITLFAPSMLAAGIYLKKRK